MKSNQENINILINKIREITPEPGNSKDLTDQIMEKLKLIPQKKHRRRVIFIQSFSSVAAVLLILLFLFQKNNHGEKNEKIPYVNVAEYRVNINASCLEETEALQIYICHQQQNSQKNKKIKNLTKK